MTNKADIAAQRRPGRPRRLSGRRAGDGSVPAQGTRHGARTRRCARGGGRCGMGVREWHPEQGFPTARQMARMVAAEVRAQVEAAMQCERDKAAKAEIRRDRLRGVARCRAARPHRARRGGDAGGLRRSRISHQPWPGRAERTEERRDACASAVVARNSRFSSMSMSP